MNIILRSTPGLPDDVSKQVDADVCFALSSIVTLNDRFIVNPSLWFSDKGRPMVMNQADFISRKFQCALRDSRHWSIEANIDGERIDAFTMLSTSGQSATISPSRIREFFDAMVDGKLDRDIDLEFTKFFQKFVKRNVFIRQSLPMKYRRFATMCGNTERPVRIGLEFETGNIASSSRALAKLDILFRLGRIDAGVFITCADKQNAATKIWPSSNRNGSLEELDNHNYWKHLTVPLWIYGFQPDSFSEDAKFLRADGSLYEVVDMGRTKRIDGTNFRAYKRFGNETVYRRVDL